MQGGQAHFAGHHFKADKALCAAVISLAQGHYPEVPVQAEDGLADAAGRRADVMGQGEERYIADGVKTTREQVLRNIWQASSQRRS